MKQIKYPKTPYLPWSPSVDEEDPVADPSNFLRKKVCVSVKMDGSNIAMNRHGIYGRSEHHPSLNEVKAKWGGIRWMIPEGTHFFGESLVAKHSIHYAGELALADNYQVFAVYQEDFNYFTETKRVEELCEEVGLEMVSHLYFEFDTIKHLELAINKVFEEVVKRGHEGVVIRNAGPFLFDKFGENMAKMVRPHHVQSEKHWSNQPFVKNELRNAEDRGANPPDFSLGTGLPNLPETGGTGN